MKKQSTILSCASGFLLTLAAVTSVQADEMPLPKLGLWEMKTSVQIKGMGKMPETTMRRCIDQADEKEAKAMLPGGNPGQTCSKNDVRKTASGYVIDSVCSSKDTGMAQNSHVEITGDIRSNYTMKGTIKTVGGDNGETNMVTQARWISACPAGWKPGDVEMNGHRSNLR